MESRGAAEELARVVAARCRADEEEFRHRDVPPLPVHLRVGGLSVPAERLVDVVAARPGDRLFLQGGAGSGKTTIARRLVLDLLTVRRPNDPVPILLPLSWWRAEHQPLRDLVVEHLGGDSIRGLRELARGGRVYYVLDGLGESTRPTPAQVLAGLHRDLADGQGLVLTCRGDAYSALVAAGRPLARAAVVTVEPVRPGDVAAWLPAEPRWAPVIADLTRRPDGPVAEALSTPDVATLARSAYARTGEPGELVAAGPRAVVEGRVLDRLLPAHGVPDRASLAFLAAHLRRSGTRDLAWWRLPAAVPEVVRGLFAQCSAGLLLGVALGLATGGPALFWLGLGFGLTFGLSGWPTGGRGGAVAWRATIVTMFTLMLAEVYQPLVGVGVGVGIGVLAWLGYGRLMGLVLGLVAAAGAGLVAWLPGEHVWALVIGGFVAFATGIAFWAVLAEVRNRPARIGGSARRPALASFLRRFAGGFAASLLATIFVAFVGRAGVAVALALGVACGLLAGVTVWLEAAGRTFQGAPMASLKADRRAALAGGLVTGALIGSGAWLAVVLFVRFSRVTAFDAADAVPVGIVAGLAAGVATVLSRSWGGLALARVWFTLTGRLPRRVMAFLAEMRRYGVLVELGAAYRFRSARLQDHLDRVPEDGGPTPRPGPR